MANLSTNNPLNSTYELIAGSIRHSKAALRWYGVFTYTDYYSQKKVEFMGVCDGKILQLLFSDLQKENSFITSDKFPPGTWASDLKFVSWFTDSIVNYFRFDDNCVYCYILAYI